MYIPKSFEQADTAQLHELMRTHPFASLVVSTPSGLEVNHLPLVLDPDAAPLGVLRAHVARSNPVWLTYTADTPAAAR